MIDLRLACPAIDVDLDAATLHALAKEFIGQIVGTVQYNVRIGLRLGSHALLELGQ